MTASKNTQENTKPRTHLRKYVLLGAGAGAAVLATMGLMHAKRATPAAPTLTASDPTPGAETSPATVDDAVDRAPGCVFQEGDKLAYQLDMTVKTKIDTDKANIDPSINDTPQLTRTSSAKLALRAVKVDPKEGATLLARFTDVDRVTTQAAGDITPPFLVRIAPSCKISGYARLSTTPIREARAAQAMLHELQFSWTENGERTADGENGYGVYTATFTASRGPTIVRRIAAYTRAWEDAWSRGLETDDVAAAHEHPTLASEMTVKAGRGPWFSSLEGSERMPGVLASETQTRTKAETIASLDQTLTDAPITGDRYIWENLLPKKVKAREIDAMSSRDHKELDKLKKVPLPEAMGKFLKRVENKENISQQWPELSRYMRARPEMTHEIAKELRSGSIPEEATAAVYLAMGKTPTPEAKRELLAINADTAAPTIDRARAAFALVDRADVGIDFARTLRNDSRAVSTGLTRMQRVYAREATLALGMMAGLKGEEEPAIMEESRGATVDLLREGRTAVALRPAFKAVANMGDPSMLPTVEPYMRHADPEVRRGAAFAFRRMAPSATSTMTASWLARENDPDVKRTLYKIVQLQHHDADVAASPEIVARAIADLDARPGTLTRQSLVRILGRASATMPEAKAALLRHARAEVEAKQGVEELMRKYLSAAEMADAMKGAR